MLPMQSRAAWLAQPSCFKIPKVFHIFASPLPAEKRAFQRQTETPVIFLFSTACGGLSLQPLLMDAPRSHPPASQTDRSKSRAKWTPEYGYCALIPALHSYRRISTGRSRTAARAGKIVAAIEIPSATVVIHTPSKIFEWNGT